MIGRAALYGLGAGGQAGVARDHRAIASELPGEFAKRN